jgi:cytochrome P450
VRARAASPSPPDDLLGRIIASWHDAPPAAREIGVARDVVLIHMGSQSNLYAAMAWTLVALLERPSLLAQVRAGDDGVLEACANEAIRLAQRSITLRQVCRDVDFDDGRQRYRLAPGTLVTTMLSVTNRSAAPGLDAFDPGRWNGRRLAAADDLPARELVSTFGHGRHACPAQRFSIAAIRIAVGTLCRRFELEPGWREVRPLRQQLGGVARADRPCPLGYRVR